MERASGRDDVDVTPSMPSLPIATKSSALDPASTLSTLKNVPLTEGLVSAQKQITQEGHECDEAIDWENIAEYLSRCQSSHSIPSKRKSSSLDLTDRQTSNIPSNNRYRDHHLLRRNPSAVPSGLDKAPQNAAPRLSTPSPDSTSTPSEGLSTGAKAGIAGGIGVGIVLLLVSLVAFHAHRRRKRSGYQRSKGRDGIPSDMEGHFIVTGRTRGESSPMMYDSSKDSELIGLTSENIPRDRPSPPLGDVGGLTPLMTSGFNVSSHSDLHYPLSPTREDHLRYNAPSIRPTSSLYEAPAPVPVPIPQPEVETLEDPFEQHNQRARPSHPLASLSEAIPPPPLEMRRPHSMADYQNAVPLGFANGFVQVGREDDGAMIGNANEGERTQHSLGRTEGRSSELNIGRDEEREGPDGDESLPIYEETDATRERPQEKKDEAGRRDDDDSDSEEERRFEIHLTKSDLG